MRRDARVWLIGLSVSALVGIAGYSGGSVVANTKGVDSVSVIEAKPKPPRPTRTPKDDKPTPTEAGGTKTK